MEKLKKFVTLNEFEDGWDIDKYAHEDLLYEYCLDALFIPEDNLDELAMNDNGILEIVFKDLELEDLREDWFTYLQKIALDYGDA